MRLWPFGSKVETRSSSATDSLVAAILATAQGGSAAEVAQTAAAQIAASLYESAFGVAEWEGVERNRLEVVTAHLPAIARALILRGEWVGVIRSAPLRIVPASDWLVRGRGAEPEAWSYVCDLAGPDGREKVRSRSEGVLHFRRGVEAARPWQGVSPLRAAGLTARVLAELEAMMADEAAGPRGYVLPVPSDGQAERVAELRRDVAKLRGKVALVETTTAGWGEGRTAAPMSDWQAHRLGAAFPSALETARASASAAILTACGVPPALAEPGADGTASREAYRRFLHVGCAPLARIIAAEVQSKLETGSAWLAFGELAAADVAGRARALGSLVTAGVELAEAREIAGLG